VPFSSSIEEAPPKPEPKPAAEPKAKPEPKPQPKPKANSNPYAGGPVIDADFLASIGATSSDLSKINTGFNPIKEAEPANEPQAEQSIAFGVTIEETRNETINGL
jgi:hypothetical protein